MDNGPEFIKPGNPSQKSFVEHCNRTYSTEVLDCYLPKKQSEVRQITETGYMSTMNRDQMNHFAT